MIGSSHVPEPPGEAPGTSGTGRRPLLTALRVVFPIAIIVLAFATVVDEGELWRTLVSASIPFVAACFAIACLDLVVMGSKWRILLRAYGIRVPPVAAIGAYFRSEVFSLFLPSILGTDGYRAWYFQRMGFGLRPVISSMVVERAVGFLSSVAVVGLLGPLALGSITDLSGGWMLPSGIALWAMCWAGLLSVTASAHVAPRWRVWRWLPRPAAVFVIRSLRSLARVKDHVGAVALYFAISQAEKMLYGVVIWLAAQAVQLTEVPLLTVVAATPVIALLERLPISIRAIGIREGLYVALLQPFGIGVSVALSVAVIVRIAELGRAGVGLAWWTSAPVPDLGAAGTRAAGAGAGEAAPSDRASGPEPVPNGP